MLAKIINERTKQVMVGSGNNSSFYESIGMTEMEVEKAWNNNWYVKGYAPEKPEDAEDLDEEQVDTKSLTLDDKRQIRNGYLQDSDKYMLPDFPITTAQRNKWKEYRVYLRDFFNNEATASVSTIKTFEEYFEN